MPGCEAADLDRVLDGEPHLDFVACGRPLHGRNYEPQDGITSAPERLEVLGHRHPEGPGDTGRVVESLLGLDQGRQRWARVGHELGSGGRQREAVGAAVEQPNRQLVLELADLSAEGRQRDAGAASRLRQAARLRGGHEHGPCLVMRMLGSACMRAYLTFTVFTLVLMALAKITGMRELLSDVADDHVITIVGCIVLVLAASALTICALRLHRGWSPE